MEEIAVGRLMMLLSPSLGRIMYEVVSINGHCPICNGDDYVVLEVVSDNNVGLEQSVGYHEPDERVEMKSKNCRKRLEKELKKNKNIFWIIRTEEEAWYKENIAKDNE